MIRIKTDFKQSVPDKIQTGYAILKALEGNPHFPPPVPIVDEFTEGLESLEQASREAVYGGRNKIAVMNLAEERHDELLLGLVGYVQSICKGDPAIAISAGFEIRGAKVASLPPGTPQAPVVKSGSRDGEVRVSWTPVRGARSYSLRISKDSGATWEDCGTYTRSRIVVSGLEQHSRPWFAVSAFSVHGHTNWSDAGQGRVA